MRFVRRHGTLVVIGLAAIAFVAAFFIFKDTVMFDESTAVYGNRLEGIDEVKITNDVKQNVRDALSSTTKKTTVRVAGKLVNIIIETNPDVSLEDAKKMADVTLEKFSEEQKKFYDFQFLIDNSENQSQFPIIGYMQHSRDTVNWTKDRQKTEG